MKKNKAIVRIARKLLNRINFVLKNQVPCKDGITSKLEHAADYKRIDKAEQDQQLFQYPHSLSEDEFLVGFSLFQNQN